MGEVTALGMITKFIGWIAGFLGVYLMYGFKITQSRIKKLEDDLSDQKVINQSFTDYKEYKDKKDEEFTESVKKIGDKIDGLNKSFDTKFTNLTKEIHELELKFTVDKK